MNNLKTAKNRVSKTLLILSLLANFIFVSILCFQGYTSKDSSEYFSFINSPFSADSVNRNMVVLVGNSITANWSNLRPDFFTKSGYLNRGVGGNSSSQILLRLQHDVLALDPDIVVLNAGINDIGEADGFYSEEFTMRNFQSIVDICKNRGVTLILSSVLPGSTIRVNRFRQIEQIEEKVSHLNLQIQSLATQNALKYIDYHSKLKNEDGSFNNKYNFDGIHPNVEGYIVMENLLQETVNQVYLERQETLN